MQPVLFFPAGSRSKINSCDGFLRSGFSSILLQGPIYLHLLLPVIIILVGFSETNPRRTLACRDPGIFFCGSKPHQLVPGAGDAGICLVFPAHACKRTTLVSVTFPFLLYGSWSACSRRWPASGRIFILSGNLANWRAFYSSTTSALLWYRLWPNETFSLGILPAIVIVSLPLILIIVWKLWKQPGILHPLRLFGLSAELLVLFAGGLIVSVKIGAGGDLHNLDAYIILLMVVAGTLFWNRQENESDSPEKNFLFPWPLAALGILVPVLVCYPIRAACPRL